MTTATAPLALRAESAGPAGPATEVLAALPATVPPSTAAPPPPAARPPQPARPPPYTRFVALQIFYLGWGYSGFTSQGRPDDGTVEAALLGALRRTGLVPRLDVGDHTASPSSLFAPEFTRCGRTDKGVSGVGQVVALRLRSRLGPDGVRAGAGGGGGGGEEAGDQAASPAPTPTPSTSRPATAAGDDPDADEIDYVRTLNGALPPTIRVTAWAPAPPGFSARFSAAWRRYRYFLVEETGAGCGGGGASTSGAGGPSPPGGLDLGAMRRAASHLVGSHDFRNFCRADIPAVTNFRRTIKSLTIERIGGGGEGGEGEGEGKGLHADGDAPISALPGAPAVPPLRLSAGLIPPGQDGVVLTLTGAAFLWHQVRCIVAVLAMVGRGLEPPSIVAAMLDTGPGGAFPAKPQYVMAPDRPLLFCGAGFCGGDLAWRRGSRGSGGVGPGAPGSALAGVRELLREQVAGTLLLAAVAAQLEAEEAADADPAARPPSRKRVARHKPLATRQCDPPLEARLAAKGLAIVEGDPTRPAAAGVDGMEIVEPGRR